MQKQEQDAQRQRDTHNAVRIDATAAANTDHTSSNPHSVSQVSAITNDSLPLSESLANIPQMQDLPRAFSCYSTLSESAPPRSLSTLQGLLRAMQVGQAAIIAYHNGNGTSSMATPPAQHSRICLRHADAVSMEKTMHGPLSTNAMSRAFTAATPTGLAMPAGALAMTDIRGVSGCQGEERHAEVQWKEGTTTHESFHHQATVLSNKRRTSRMDLSKLTAEEQERWINARARQYSASARLRRLDRVQDLRDQVETSSVFQVLVEAAPDAVLLFSPDERALILFANDQCGHLLRLDSSNPKGQALVGRSLWEWMDAQDKAAVVAAIGVCLFCKDATKRVHCTLYRPRSSVTLQSGGAMQHQAHQEPHHYQQQWKRQQEAIRADLTFRSSERGLVIFMRPDKTGEKGM